MTSASIHIPAGHWSGEVVDSVTLTFEDRHRRRVMLKGDHGFEFLLNLPKAVIMAQGDGLQLDDGRIVEVIAAREKLAEIQCRDPLHLLRLAWHLGNRHLPTEIREDSLRIAYDHVIVDMACKLGAEVAVIQAPFNPEGGAYGDGHVHGHSHD